MSVRIKLNQAAIRSLSDPGGTIDQAVRRAAGKTRDEAKAIVTSEGRIDTGLLRNSIRTQRVGDAHWQVGSDVDYALYQHEGVRPFGPKRKRFLRFIPKGGSTYVFAKRVRGFRGIKYLTRALDRLTARDFAR